MRTVVTVLAFIFIIWIFVQVVTPLLEKLSESLRMAIG